MKFSLFVHMERNDPAKPHAELFDELVELVEIAEAGGFDIAWIGEHHGMEFTIAPNPFIYLSNLAQRTKTIRLGTGTIVAPYWHPLKLAGEAGITDIITGGRLELGIARGAYQFEFDRLCDGMPGPEGGAHLREIIPAIKGLWGKNYAHEGDIWNFPETTPSPLPLQQPHPPIWVAARDISSHEFAVENDCNVMITPLWKGDEEVEDLMRKYNQALSDNPDKPRREVMLCKHAHVVEDEDQAQAAAMQYNKYFNYFGAWFMNKRPIKDGFIEPMTEEELAANPMYAPDVMRRDLLIGTPDEVITRLRQYEAWGVDQFSYWIDNGYPHAEKKKSLERFIEHIVPAMSGDAARKAG